jgi:hypothetical protein
LNLYHICIILFFSIIVDSGKTGYQIDKERIKQIRKIVGNIYPDFLMKNPSYPSQSILGILYRKALDFKNQNPTLFEVQDINNPLVPFAKVSVTHRHSSSIKIFCI